MQNSLILQDCAKNQNCTLFGPFFLVRKPLSLNFIVGPLLTLASCGTNIFHSKIIAVLTDFDGEIISSWLLSCGKFLIMFLHNIARGDNSHWRCFVPSRRFTCFDWPEIQRPSRLDQNPSKRVIRVLSVTWPIVLIHFLLRLPMVAGLATAKLIAIGMQSKPCPFSANQQSAGKNPWSWLF